MSKPDLNLLYTLDALLAEGSVVRAARRLRLSPSAMSRSFARLRETVGDPLLVRVGRGLVLTPRGMELREQAARLVQDALHALGPVAMPDLQELSRTFTIRSSEGFVENFGIHLMDRLQQEAPHLRLHFVQKEDRSSTSLRDGSVDLETGVVGKVTSPELRTQALFRDRFVGVVREGHPLAEGKVTRARYVAGRHVAVLRKGVGKDFVDEALANLGMERQVAMAVSGFSAAIALARNSDLIATVPGQHTRVLRQGMHSFGLPFRVPEITVSLLWHPRLDADPVHRWLRQCIREACAAPREVAAG